MLCHNIGGSPPVQTGPSAGSATGAAEEYLASRRRGVAVHLVVRVVVTALESALPDATDSKDSKDAHTSHILKRVPVCKQKVKSSTLYLHGPSSQLQFSNGFTDPSL